MITIIIFIYSTADKLRNQHRTNTNICHEGGKQQLPRRAALCTEGLSTAKLLPHTAHSG